MRSRCTIKMHSEGTVKAMQQRYWFHNPDYKLLLYIFKNVSSHALSTLPNWHLPPSPLRPTLSFPWLGLLAKMPAPSCLTLGFLAFSWRWSNPSEQYWTSHSIQTSFLLYCFCLFSKNLLPIIQFLIFPFGFVCIPCTVYLFKNKGVGEVGQSCPRKAAFSLEKHSLVGLTRREPAFIWALFKDVESSAKINQCQNSEQ